MTRNAAIDEMHGNVIKLPPEQIVAAGVASLYLLLWRVKADVSREHFRLV